jgi:hypothetical protein
MRVWVDLTQDLCVNEGVFYVDLICVNEIRGGPEWVDLNESTGGPNSGPLCE